MFAVTTACINWHNSANSARATCKQSIYKGQLSVAIASCCILWQLLTSLPTRLRSSSSMVQTDVRAVAPLCDGGVPVLSTCCSE